MELTARKVTIYRKSEFGLGYTKVECSKFGYERRPYAQYPGAVHVHCVPKRKRKTRWFVETDFASCVVLEGHGHPDPDSPWTEWQDEGAVKTRQGRYMSCDPAWDKEFGEMIDAYIAKSGARVVLDCRKNDPYKAASAA